MKANIADYLPEMAHNFPNRMAVVFPHGHDHQGRVAYTHLSFAQLNRDADLLGRGLAQLGVKKGTRTVLMVKPSLNFFALTFALFKMGSVPVFIDPGMGLANLKKCLGEAQPEVFIGIPKAHLARILLRWPEMRLKVAADGWFPGMVGLPQLRKLGQSSSLNFAATTRKDLAAILFTTGSTGVPKGAMYTQAVFLKQVEQLKEMYHIRPGEVDLATFPLFALFAPALGMTAIIPDMDATRPALVDPIKIFQAIEDFGVTNMFGSPALLNRVGRFGTAHGMSLPTLKRVVSAGAPVQAAILETFAKMLAPDTQIHTPYGATESLPVCTIGSREILTETAKKTAEGHGVCVGKPVTGIKVRIIAVHDQPIKRWQSDLEVPPGTIGEITVKGAVVSQGYFNRPASNDLAKIEDPEDGLMIHRMGDLGYFDELGRLWFCGRKSHRIKTVDGDMYSVPNEGIFNGHPKVFRTALVGVPTTDGYQKPVLCVETEAEVPEEERSEISRELLQMGAQYPQAHAIKTVLFHPGFPVDIRHNAKIFREKLALWAEKKL